MKNSRKSKHVGVIPKDRQFYRFSLYGFLKNLKFFEPFIVLFFRDAGLSFLQIGFLFSIRDLSTNMLEVPTGVYADAFGRRKSMVMAFASYIGSFFIFYFLSSFYVYALAMVFFAVGEAFRTGTHKALILEYLKLNDIEHLKVEYYGRTRAASQLGAALNALGAAALVFYSGNYRPVFIASVIPYVIDLINLATYPAELDGELVRTAATGIGEQLRSTLRVFVSMFRDLAALRAILSSSGFNAAFKVGKEYLQPILKSVALSLPLFVALEDTKRAALVVGVVYFVLYLLTSYASRSSAQFSVWFKGVAQGINLTFVGGALLLIFSGLATRQGWGEIAIAAFFGLYLVYNVRRPMTVAFISDQISSRVMAAGLSAESQVTTIIQAALAPLLGAIADGFGIGAAVGALGALMLVVTMPLWVRAAQVTAHGQGVSKA
jgi:MFS family permease